MQNKLHQNSYEKYPYKRQKSTKRTTLCFSCTKIFHQRNYFDDCKPLKTLHFCAVL
nr:MAG TPA: hypothetical protein [Caudoviricetes sp.]